MKVEKKVLLEYYETVDEIITQVVKEIKTSDITKMSVGNICIDGRLTNVKSYDIEFYDKWFDIKKVSITESVFEKIKKEMEVE